MQGWGHVVSVGAVVNRQVGVPSSRITDILNGWRSITADTAVLLGRYFGNSAQFWLDLAWRRIFRISRQIVGDLEPRRLAGDEAV